MKVGFKLLGVTIKKELIEPKLTYISVSTQCKLLNLNPSSLYYKLVFGTVLLWLHVYISFLLLLVLWLEFEVKF